MLQQRDVLLGALFGLILGSFGTVLTTRVPRGESIVKPGSRCRSCHAPIAWHDNIPLISYIVLRGRCRHCGQPILWTYPAIELSTAVLFALVYTVAGISALSLGFAVLAVVTPPLVVIDLREKRLPRPFTWALIVAGVVGAVLVAVAQGSRQSLVAIGLGAALFAFFLILNLASRGGMGMGDAHLAAGLGLVLGLISWKAPVAAVAIAFATSALVAFPLLFMAKVRMKTAIPFGPFLLLGAWIVVIGGSTVVDPVLGFWGVS